MKKIVYYVIGLTSSLLWSCGNMNSVNQEWIDRGEMIYTGAPDSLKIHPGYERLKLEWEVNADPRITEIVISWNNKKNTLALPVTRDTPDKVGIHKESIMIDKDIEEGMVVFLLFTRDDKGHTSIIKEVSSQVYGEIYAQAASLRVPRKTSSIRTLGTTVQLIFKNIESTDIEYTNITYTSYENSETGELKTLKVANNESLIELKFVKPGDKLILKSNFLPVADAIDSFPGMSIEMTIPNPK